MTFLLELIQAKIPLKQGLRLYFDIVTTFFINLRDHLGYAHFWLCLSSPSELDCIRLAQKSHQNKGLKLKVEN